MAYKGRGRSQQNDNTSPKHQQGSNTSPTTGAAQNNNTSNGNHNTTSPPTSTTPVSTLSDNTQQQQQTKKQPRFIKVSQLEPGTRNLNLVLKPVSINVLATEAKMKKMIEMEPINDLLYSNTAQPGRMNRKGSRVVVAEAVVGDETGTVVLTVTHPKQLAVLQEALQNASNNNNTIVVRGGRIELFKGYMRLHLEPIFGCLQLLNKPSIRQLYSEELLARMNDNWTVNQSHDASSQLYKVVYEEE